MEKFNLLENKLRAANSDLYDDLEQWNVDMFDNIVTASSFSIDDCDPDAKFDMDELEGEVSTSSCSLHNFEPEVATEITYLGIQEEEVYTGPTDLKPTEIVQVDDPKEEVSPSSSSMPDLKPKENFKMDDQNGGSVASCSRTSTVHVEEGFFSLAIKALKEVPKNVEMALNALKEKKTNNSGPTPVLRIESGHCAKEVLNGVRNLRNINESYCDLHVKVDDKSFPVHKIILAGFSPYFAKMLISDQHASQQCIPVFELTGMTAATFEGILNYCYNSAISISADNAEDFLRASYRLEISHLADLCAKYMGETINTNNYLNMYTIASELSCSILANAASDFIHRYFGVLCKQDSFLKMTPEMLIDAIKSDDLRVSNEDIVLDAVMRWVNHDVDRELVFSKIVQYLRLAFVNAEALKSYVKDESCIRTSADCIYWFSQVQLFQLQPIENRRPADLQPMFTKPRRSTPSGLVNATIPSTFDYVQAAVCKTILVILKLGIFLWLASFAMSIN